MKKLLSVLLSLTILLAFTACKSEDKKETQENTQTEQKTEQKADTTAEPQKEDEKEEATDADKDLYADPINFTIELENGGVMSGELYPNLAPLTVKNFVKLVKDKFYDGLIFHRVIEGFMIQGGGYDVDMVPKEAEPIKGEFAANGFENNLKHTKGVLSMARTNDPDSASSQFFIMHEDSPHLDGQYAAFGRITKGLEVIDEIATAKTTVFEKYQMPDYPEKPIIIKTIKLD